MTTPTTVTFVGAKGGVGTTTVAALHALDLPRRGHSVRLSASSTTGIEDLAALLGIPAPAGGQAVDVVPGLTLGDQLAADADNVVDAGTDTVSDHDGSAYLVLRNDYLSLRRALNTGAGIAGLVLVVEPDRALSARDVTDVLAQPLVAELRVDPVIARAADAGLLSTTRHARFHLSLPVQPVSTH